MEIDAPWLLAVGVLVVAGAVLDVVWTTTVVGGGRGPFANAVAQAVWRTGAAGSPSHRRLQVTGIVTLVAVPLVWLALIWTGFSLMYAADAEAVVDATTSAPESGFARIAFAAGGLAGAGAGMVAGTPPWQFVNNVSALVGLGLFTLVVAYLLQVVTAVKDERGVATRIAGLGDTPVDALDRALRESDLGQLPAHVTSIADGLGRIAEDHLALPMLQFFHTPRHHASIARNLAFFDELVSLMEFGLRVERPTVVAPARLAVTDFLRTIQLRTGADEPLPTPSLDRLRALTDGVDVDRFEAGLADLADRRARLLAYLRQERWDVADVHGDEMTGAEAG